MKPEKRSFSIAGHRTSISLEAAFWEALRAIAAEHSLSLAELVAQVDGQRGRTNLSSAVRVYILQHYREKSQPPAADPTT